MTATERDSVRGEADRLIEAAWDVLGRTGFEGFKVASVIRAAGSSTKAFYRHFASKDALFLALLIDETRRASERMAHRVAAASSPSEAVKIWIATMIGAAGRPDLASRARLFASLDRVNSMFPERIRQARQPLLAPLRAALGEGDASGEFPRADPDRDVAIIVPLCGGVLRELLDGTAGSSVEDAIANTQRFVLRSLGAGDS